MLRKHVVLFALIMLVAGCRKESLRSDQLTGSWNITKIDLMNDSETYTMQVNGRFVFQKSEKEFNAGGTVYGKDLSCNADMPEVSGVAPSALLKFKNRTLYFTEPIDPDNYNYTSFYRGIIGWFELDNLVNYMSCEMSLQNNGELIVRIANKGKLNANDYTLIYIHLERL